jgi:hypothetical protein
MISKVPWVAIKVRGTIPATFSRKFNSGNSVIPSFDTCKNNKKHLTINNNA